MSEAPSSAAWKITEFTSRTSGASEMPSSTSRSSASSSSASSASSSSTARAGAERLRRAGEAPDLVQDVVARGDGEVERIPRREPKLVDALDVPRVRDRHPQRPVLDRVRDRGQPLQHMEGDLSARLVGDAREREVDEGHLVPGCKRPGEALAGRDVLLDERLGERAHAGRAACNGQLVRGHQAGSSDQVRDKLGERVDRRRRAADPSATGRRRVPGLGAGAAKIQWTLDVHIPRSRYRQQRADA